MEVFSQNIDRGHRQALDRKFTEAGSAQKGHSHISYALLINRDGAVIACDEATRLPEGIQTEPLLKYFHSKEFLAYLSDLGKNKKAMKDLGVTTLLGELTASSYRFGKWLLTIKPYGQAPIHNTLIVLSGREGFRLGALEDAINDLENSCEEIIYGGKRR